MGPGTMLNSWADAMLAELSSPECEQQDAQIQEVDDIRSQTSDASETEPSQSDESVLEHRWWVSRLFSSVERLGFLDAIENAKSQAHAAKRQLQVLSCCTGCCAETEVLKAASCSALRWHLHMTHDICFFSKGNQMAGKRLLWNYSDLEPKYQRK